MTFVYGTHVYMCKSHPFTHIYMCTINECYLIYGYIYIYIYIQAFFSLFSKFWFLGSLEWGWGERGGTVKRTKMAQNDKNFCLSHSVSQEPYIKWLWFLAHMCKMMISPVFKILILGFFRGVKGQKMT